MKEVSARKLCLSFVLASAGATAGAQTTEVQRPAGENWPEYKMSLADGEQGYEARWAVFNEGAAGILVCGVGIHDFGKRDDNLKALEDLGLYLGDDLVMTGMDFFAEVFRKSDLSKAKANCRASDKKVSDYASSVASLRPTRPFKRN